MSRPHLLLVALIAVWTAACGHKIGDACNVSTDCAQDGTRVCDTFSPGGSCTIQGCDFGTCPDEAVCVRFFPALENAKTCASTSECAVEEICTVGGQCAPRSIEQRFCMLTCEDSGDCRDQYECRDQNLMRLHGGEPVPDPRATTDTPLTTAFCASKRTCNFDSDCASSERCESTTRLCVSR